MRQTFIEVPFPCHLKLKAYKINEMDASGCALNTVFTQSILDDIGQWNPMDHFTLKIISAKTLFKTYDNKPLVIVQALKM